MKIKELTLHTSNLEQQFDFYSKTLGMQVLQKKPQQFKVQIGNSILSFIQKENTTPYHFAFNISSNQEDQALHWLKSRVPILKNEDQEIIDFTAWNAKAIYFYDRDQNIVEFIARKNLKQDSNLPFNSNSLLEISEIGVATAHVKNQYTFLNNSIGLTKYSGDFDRFCAIGSENGLFICIDNNQKDWFPNNDTAHSSNFSIKIDIKDHIFELKFDNSVFTLINS